MARGRSDPSDILRITLDGEKDLDAAIKKISKDYPKDNVRALNTTAAKSVTLVRRQVAASIGLKQKDISKRVKKFNANVNRPIASVWIGTKSGIMLGGVNGARTSLKGVLKSGKTVTQTFRARMPSGHVGQFVRKDGSKHKERPDGQRTELPIEAPRIRLAGVGRPIIIKVTAERMKNYYPVELKRLIAVTNAKLEAKAKK